MTKNSLQCICGLRREVALSRPPDLVINPMMEWAVTPASTMEERILLERHKLCTYNAGITERKECSSREFVQVSMLYLVSREPNCCTTHRVEQDIQPPLGQT